VCQPGWPFSRSSGGHDPGRAERERQERPLFGGLAYRTPVRYGPQAGATLRDIAAAISNAAATFQAEVFGRLDAPKLLHDAWVSGRIGDRDLADLIPQTWLFHDWPEMVIGASNWVAMFRAAGFLLHPTNLARPVGSVMLYRGATPDRARAMAWNLDRTVAEHFQRRYGGPRIANLYRTLVSQKAMLAVLSRGTEGSEIVIDPNGIDIMWVDTAQGTA
jgi:hypothetical protein